MWAIVGLGNPGRKYARTRHNVGFRVLEELAARHGVELKERDHYRIGKGSLEGEEAVFVEPLTFMNRSGTAVREILKSCGVPLKQLVVVHDDLDLDTGRLKIKMGGSSGGHKGVQSVLDNTGSGAGDFIRVRIGIGRDVEMLAEDYVLKKFSRRELTAVKKAVSEAADAVAMVVSGGVEHAMNLYNKKP